MITCLVDQLVAVVVEPKSRATRGATIVLVLFRPAWAVVTATEIGPVEKFGSSPSVDGLQAMLLIDCLGGQGGVLLPLPPESGGVFLLPQADEST